MAGGSPAPVNRQDAASHINPTYDSDEDGIVEKARQADTATEADTAADAEKLGGKTADELAPAIANKQVATTFGESFVSVSGGVSNGSVGFRVADSLNVPYNFDPYLSYTNRTHTFTVNKPMIVTGVNYRGTDEQSTNIPLNTPLSVGETYTITTTNTTGTSYNYNEVIGGEYFSLTADSSDYIYGISGFNIQRLDATRRVSFTAPSPTEDVFGWDVATFSTTTPGNSQLDIYIEDGNGNELAGPIQRGDSIPADPNDNPRFRIVPTVNADAAEPTLDMIGRRWKL